MTGLDVYTGGNLRTLPVRPYPEVYLRMCYPHPTETRLLYIIARMRSDLFTVCLHYHDIIHVYFNAQILTIT